MNKRLTITTLLTIMLLGFVLAANGSAMAQQTDTAMTPWPPGEEGHMPPLEGGAPYTLPISPSQPETSSRQDGAATELTIDVWYGPEQSFGELGTPQTWLNILGAVSGPLPIQSLTYSLNGGPELPLALGIDKQRLFGEGHFNIELDHALVTPLPGSNSVVITADDGQTVVETTVTVTYDDTTVWPLPYTADWSAVSSVTEAGQVVDGLWELNNGALENVTPGFDRLVAFGSQSWTEYEVTVPVTVHTLNTAEWRGPSNGGGVGIIVRWPGHYNIAGEQPSLGWRHLGALGWYHWSPTGDAAFELKGQGGQNIVVDSSQQIELGVDYIFKMRVESLDGPSLPATYSFKFWEAGEDEPDEWTMQAVGRVGEPTSGSAVLVAHQSEVTFGNVTILPLNDEGLRVTVEETENGRITVNPNKSIYQPGEEVEFQAMPDPGYKFVGWEGDLAGDENPQSVLLSGDLTVGATFEPEVYQVFISPVTAGIAGGLSYTAGDILTLGDSGQWTRMISAANGPLGKKSDIEALTFMGDGSLLVVPGARMNVPNLGKVMPSDVIRVVADASGNFDNGTVELYLDGSAAGLTTAGERIDALAVDGDGRLLIATKGVARVKGTAGEVIVAQNEDILRLTSTAAGGPAWEMVCDGTLVPGMAAEAIDDLTMDPNSGALYINTRNAFNIGGVHGVAQDIIALSECSPSAQVTLIWNSRDFGFKRPFDAFHFMPDTP